MSAAFFHRNFHRNDFRLLASAVLVCGIAMPVSAAPTDHGGGTGTDSVAGPMWMKCSRGQSGANCTTGGATGYWLVRAAADPVPTPAELIAGRPGVAAGNGATASGQARTFAVPGLKSGMQYMLYYAAPDGTGHNLNPIRKLALAGGVSGSGRPALDPARNRAGMSALALTLIMWRGQR